MFARMSSGMAFLSLGKVILVPTLHPCLRQIYMILPLACTIQRWGCGDGRSSLIFMAVVEP